MAATTSNRDRFYEIIEPMFIDSKFVLIKPERGKYREKLINIVNSETSSIDFQIWCHILDNRLDLMIKDTRLPQIPEKLKKEFPVSVTDNQRLDHENASTYRRIEEEVLRKICMFISKELI